MKMYFGLNKCEGCGRKLRIIDRGEVSCRACWRKKHPTCFFCGGEDHHPRDNMNCEMRFVLEPEVESDYVSTVR